ncbi:MAG: 50S ribosomal protein L28 [Candidatus Pelagibacter sp.]|nr:50S ribosomal protein L28 [Candidatus Pelagibacter sp.]|tara:strand:+ start:125 stop:406 length:282 start_codon:yes stop_codon:yes gene_type:complete
MTNKCELTGKRPLKGHNVSHANNKTKRKFNPSIKKIRFKSDTLKKNITLKVSNAALRTVDFKGGIDKFLSTAKVYKLSKRAKKYRSKISLKEA